MVARLIGTGQLLIETRDAVRARVWQGAPDAGEFDAAVDVRFMRNADVEIVRRNEERQDTHLGTEAASTTAGKKLLKHLGI